MKLDILEERMINILRSSNLVEHIMQDAVLDDCDESSIINLK